MESQATTWSDASFVGGHPALDFVNTAGGRSRARDVERLIGWGDVLAWCGHTGVLDADEVAQLRARGDADPGAAGRAVADLRDQREALHALLLAGADGTACAPAARERVHADVVAAHRAATPSTGFTTGPAWLVDVAGVGLAVVAVRLALHAAALLADDRRGQLRVCGRCSWLFLDPSPSRRRRWCSMATCGNRAKVQRHHDRRPAGQDAGGDPPDLLARARAVLAGRVRRTPVVELDAAGLDAPGTAGLVAKLELLQHAGSFKTRGAFAHMLLRDVPDAGVVAASGGNHGAAVAYAARVLGLPATVFVPEVSSPAKVARIRSYGAELVVGGALYADARDAAADHRRRTGALDVPAFDAVETVAAQATLGAELAAQAPGLDTVLVPVGGGGLIAGVALAYAGTPTRVVGVEPTGAPTLHRALAAGEPVDAPAGGVAADSLAPRRVGEVTFPVCRDHVAGVVLVDDDAIVAAQRLLWDRLRVVVEPAAATTVAALVSGAHVPDGRTAVVLSGANTDPAGVSV